MIQVPRELAAFHDNFYPGTGREWIAKLPKLAASYLERWQLTLDGKPMHGMVGLVLPVRRADGTPAALKLQPIDEEHLGEGTALRVWDGQGAARLLDEAEEANSSMLLLERLDEDRPLSCMPDITQAVQVISELLMRLNAHQAPPEIRRLSDVIAKMLEYLPEALTVLTDQEERRMMQTWADIVSEVAQEPGDRLLHWDLHYDNVLAAEREPWLAIDPKPLAGDPGFELLPRSEE
ncbi:MAG TPA: hydroxyurea phosphotransferase, partial [Micromonosporaceae bacterium]|nr:hydroxyurea phosphotransferase [Micromonosporaceae bacterium]